MSKFIKQNNKGFTRTPKFGVTPKGGGFTLVETLIALSIFTVSILGLMSILATGISNTGYAKRKVAAEYLAQEGIEYVRNLRDTTVLYDATSSQHGWDNFKILNKDYSITDPDFAGFTRVISEDAVSFGENEIEIFSTVSWTEGSGSYNITFSEHLFNWMQ